MCRPDAINHDIRRRPCIKVQLLEKAVFGDMFAEHRSTNTNNSVPQQPPSPVSSSSLAHPRAQLSCPSNQLHDNIVVHHHYTDHAHDPPPTHIDYVELQKRCSSTATFPIRLHNLLNQMETDGYAHVLSWQPHGRSFGIHRPKDFKFLLPQYFHGVSKVASFQRQLNLYGFQRITQGRDKGCYYHEFFLRDRIYLAYKIQRFKIKGTGVRGKANPDEEPDLYAMEWVGSDHKTTTSSSEHHASSSSSTNKGATQQRASERPSTTPPPSPLKAEVVSLEPIPISSSISTYNSNNHTPTMKDKRPCMLAEFGKTFFALDSVSDDQNGKPNTVPQQQARESSSSAHDQSATAAPSPWNDLCDPLYIDRALNDMFRDWQQHDGMDWLLDSILHSQ